MRIIAGQFRGRTIRSPKGLPVRPTTDRTKESLFNILQNWYDWEALRVLDLFAGTGNISLEFLSRGVKDLTAVDKHAGCVRAIKTIQSQWGIPDGKVLCRDVWAFVRQWTGQPYDIIFLDPPYAMPRQTELVSLILEKGMLAASGSLIAEHSSHINMKELPYFEQEKVYGASTLSFFSMESL